jgi:methylated-DNA-[protein]-cysteine S-methyltransferase
VIALLRDVTDGNWVSNEFSLVDRNLSDYARRVIRAVSLIPVGHVAPYGFVARVAGGSPRAVGRVMASNPFSLTVPCHRVFRSDFKLGGRSPGFNVKFEILKRESRGYGSERDVSSDEKDLLVFPVEFVSRRLAKGKC